MFLILFSTPTSISQSVLFFFFRSDIGQKPDGILICISRAVSWEGSGVLARAAVSLASSSSLGSGFRFSWAFAGSGSLDSESSRHGWLPAALLVLKLWGNKQFPQAAFSVLSVDWPFGGSDRSDCGHKTVGGGPQSDKQQMFVFSKQMRETVTILFSRCREENNIFFFPTSQMVSVVLDNCYYRDSWYVLSSDCVWDAMADWTMASEDHVLIPNPGNLRMFPHMVQTGLYRWGQAKHLEMRGLCWKSWAGPNVITSVLRQRQQKISHREEYKPCGQRLSNRATSQEKAAATGRWKGWGNGFSLEPPEEARLWWPWIFALTRIPGSWFPDWEGIHFC